MLSPIIRLLALSALTTALPQIPTDLIPSAPLTTFTFQPQPTADPDWPDSPPFPPRDLEARQAPDTRVLDFTLFTHSPDSNIIRPMNLTRYNDPQRPFSKWSAGPFGDELIFTAWRVDVGMCRFTGRDRYTGRLTVGPGRVGPGDVEPLSDAFYYCEKIECTPIRI